MESHGGTQLQWLLPSDKIQNLLYSWQTETRLLCIRTAHETLAYTQALMGLLGMVVFQDKLSDHLFGDLVLAGKLCKIVDNIYFRGDTVPDLSSIFEEFVERVHISNLQIKPSKIKIHIKSTNILGLLWQGGTLTPSKHKLDALAHCDKPTTVKGVCSSLGGVRSNEVCLNGVKLAAASHLLDQEIPETRPEKDRINWTPDLIQSFTNIQEFLKNPISIVIPREGNNLFLATDSCSSIPAGGSKHIIQCPGFPGCLPSFNFRCRHPKN